jgi:hypothetical protein
LLAKSEQDAHEARAVQEISHVSPAVRGRRHRHANTGPGAASRNGCWKNWLRMPAHWSESITASPSRFAIEACGLKLDWPALLDDFQRHWPADEDQTYVDFVREGVVGNGAARMGDARWRRLTEERAGAAKSVFLFDVQGSLAKSTHAGLPWLRFIRQRLGPRVHFWPFDGWEIPPERSAVVEVYRSLEPKLPARGNAMAISTTHTRPPHGCGARISAGALPRFSIRRLRRLSARWHKSRVDPLTGAIIISHRDAAQQDRRRTVRA